MNILPDFEELLKLLEKHGVNYLIVGGSDWISNFFVENETNEKQVANS